MKLYAAFLPVLLATAAPLAATTLQDANVSTRSASSVSVVAEPALSDGRFVLRIAAQNRTREPVAFGPAAIRITTAAGEPVPVRPLAALIRDVRAAAGLDAQHAAPTVAAQQSSPAMHSNFSGQKDISGFSGGMTSGPVVQSERKRPRRPADTAAADAQIATLQAGILADTSIAPGRVVAGQLVTEKLRLPDKRKRGLIVTVTLAGEVHSFRVDAPQ
jgi:hypothetical protein